MEKEQGAHDGAPFGVSATNGIKVIETRYAGCRFRSRLEARWAVFFDTIGLEWQYEPQGFELPSGRYLPDFYVPSANAWFEIKGSAPNHREVRCAVELAHLLLQSGAKYRMLVGDVPRTPMTLAGMAGLPILQPRPSMIFIINNDVPAMKEDLEFTDDGFKVSARQLAKTPIDLWGLDRAFWGIGWSNVADIQSALNAARSARFEHGESGGPRARR